MQAKQENKDNVYMSKRSKYVRQSLSIKILQVVGFITYLHTYTRNYVQPIACLWLCGFTKLLYKHTN